MPASHAGTLTRPLVHVGIEKISARFDYINWLAGSERAGGKRPAVDFLQHGKSRLDKSGSVLLRFSQKAFAFF
jgi:hypothetical protein